MKNQSKSQNLLFENILDKIDDKIKEIQKFTILIKDISSLDEFFKTKKNLLLYFSHIEDDLRETGQSLRSLYCINKNLSEQVVYFEKKIAENEKFKEKVLFKNKELKEKLKKSESELKILNSDGKIMNNNLNNNVKPLISDKKVFQNILDNHLNKGENIQVNDGPADIKSGKNEQTKKEKDEKIREIIYLLLNSKDSLKLNQHCKNVYGSNFLQSLLAQDVDTSLINNLDITIKQFLSKQDSLNNCISKSEVNNPTRLNKSISNKFIKHTDIYSKNFINNNQPSNYHSFTNLSKVRSERSKSSDRNKRFVHYTSPHGNYFDKDYQKKFNSSRGNDLSVDDRSRTNTTLNRFSINNKLEPNPDKIYSFREKTKWRSMHDYFYSQNEDLDKNFSQKSPDKITNSLYQS